jgi:hypothetical protein
MNQPESSCATSTKGNSQRLLIVSVILTKGKQTLIIGIDRVLLKTDINPMDNYDDKV